jgi:hypothetical protein
LQNTKEKELARKQNKEQQKKKLDFAAAKVKHNGVFWCVGLNQDGLHPVVERTKSAKQREVTRSRTGKKTKKSEEPEDLGLFSTLRSLIFAEAVVISDLTGDRGRAFRRPRTQRKQGTKQMILIEISQHDIHSLLKLLPFGLRLHR